MSAKFPRGGGGANPFSAIRLVCSGEIKKKSSENDQLKKSSENDQSPDPKSDFYP